MAEIRSKKCPTPVLGVGHQIIVKLSHAIDSFSSFSLASPLPLCGPRGFSMSLACSTRSAIYDA